MTTVVANKTKAGFSAIAVFIFGLALLEIKTDEYLGIVLFAISAIVAFFAIIIDIPMTDLPPDLKDLKKDLESIDTNNIDAFLKTHQKQLKTIF